MSRLITKTCKYCGSLAKSTSFFTLDNVEYVSLSCGHTLINDKTEVEKVDYSDFESEDGRKLYPFQIAGCKFAERANFSCLIADEMGLGKTVQALAILKKHSNLLPALVLTKTSLKYQWFCEVVRWTGLVPQIIEGSDKPSPLFKIFIISVDTLRNLDWLDDWSVKTVILDECQSIKNISSKRTFHVRKLCEKADYKIALSGTPIKNKINEYFPILNILRPEIFYSPENFERTWVGSYFNGRKTVSGKLIDPARFKERTKDFIIRRERLEVLPDLPKINRSFHYTELSNETEKQYKRLVKQFVEFSDEHGGNTGGRNAGETLAYLTKMRHCVGLAKIKPTVEFIEEFLTDTDRKLTVFVHHQDVGMALKHSLTNYCNENDLETPLNLTSDLNPESRQNVITDFKNNPKRRLMIASTLASGEGLNLQFCSDCIMVERQWNPANEEQAEGRFSRIGSIAESISATYMTAIGTIDEWFMKLVEAKRKIISEGMTGEKVSWDESETLRELSSMIIAHGRKAWNF